MTHTEKVHVLLGLAGAVAGALAVWSTWRPESRARLVWPALAFLIGFFLFIPVEAQSRTYQDVGWWDTLVSAVPEHPGDWLRDWFRYLPQWHVVQHKVGSCFMMLVGVIEFRRARGRLTGPAWGWALPLLLSGIAIAFGVHGGTTEHLSHRTEQIHHRIFGLAFAVAAVSLVLVRTGRLHGRWWEGLWAILVLVVGLDIAFFYRLTPAERGMPEEHRHAGADTGMR
jgi:hypothetical protein